MAFVAFGVVAWLGFKVSGGDNDSYYTKKSEERIAKIKISNDAQVGEIIPTDSDLEKFTNSISTQNPQATKSPVPATEAFNECMK